jgi:hypothetical protein
MVEVIAGKAEHCELAVRIGAMQLLQIAVWASEDVRGGDVHNQQDGTGISVKLAFGPTETANREPIKRRNHNSYLIVAGNS